MNELGVTYEEVEAILEEARLRGMTIFELASEIMRDCLLTF